MGGFNRSAFKSTSKKKIKDQENAQAAKRPKGSKKAGYLEIEEGDNLFRAYPFHPNGGGDSFCEPKTVTFLSVEVPKRDKKGEVIDGKFEVVRKPIFNSKVHGLTKDGKPFEKDLVEEYLNFLRELLNQEYADDQDEFKNQWKKATHWKTGIKPGDSWMLYADKISGSSKEFGLLELKTSIKNGLNTLADELEGEEDVMDFDPFSDPEDGYTFKVKKNPEAEDPKDYYKVSFHSTPVPGKKGQFQMDIRPLADDDLQALLKEKPLFKMYNDVFFRTDLDYQLEGLKRFEEEAGFDVFEYEEWEDIVEEMYSLVKEPPAEDEESEEEEEDTQDESVTEDQEDDIDIEMDEDEEEEEVEDEDEPEEEPEIREEKVVPQKKKKTVSKGGDKSSTKSRLDALKKRV